MNAPPLIALDRLRTLWVHTGTACNLSCPFCHEGSSPGDTRLQAPSLAELAPLLTAAATQGVERFAFTGGEPLILKGIHEILHCALQLRPVLVITNGTAPFIRRAHQLAPLKAAPHALAFRVSIDWPDEARHDAGRGYRNFRKALEGLRLLHAAGFDAGITRQQDPGEDGAAVAARFRQLLRRQLLPEDLPVIALPELGALAASREATAGAGNTPAWNPGLVADEAALAAAPCARSRMLIRRDGRLRLTACPLVDDDPAFDQPPDFVATACSAVAPTHRRCATCLACGVRYGGI